MECGLESDVALAVRVAAERGLPVTVWGGRRDTDCRNAGAGGVVLDLRRRREAVYTPGEQTVRLQGGAIMRDIVAALPSDRAVVTTANPDVGTAGAATGGGYGPLVHRFGLMADDLLSSRLVLADGSTVVAAPGEEKELLWGLRGGGPDFGVVTETTFAVHSLKRLLFAVVVVPLASSAVTLRTVQELLDEEPDALAVLPLFTGGPEDAVGLSLVGAVDRRGNGWRTCPARTRRPLRGDDGARSVGVP